MDLSIIIVSYNTASLLTECIHSITNHMQKSLQYEIIVVDNASTDDTVTVLQHNFPKITIIENKENYGFSKANNIGIKKAKGRYILFLNPDTVFTHDGFETLLDFFASNKKVGMITCKVVLPNKQLDDACHRGFPTPWNSFCHFSGLARLFPKSKLFTGYNLGWMNLNITHQIDACAGAFMLVLRTAGEEVHWWDEDYFFYGEDIDICYKMKKKGWEIYYFPHYEILHYKGVSGGLKKASQHMTTASRETRIRSTNARFAAMKIFYEKHYTNVYPFFITFLVMQGINIKLWWSKHTL